MAVIALTDKIVAALTGPPAGARSPVKITTDAVVASLRVDVHSRGTKTWYQLVSIRGRRKAIRLGRFPKMNTAAARAMALALREMAAAGLYPDPTAVGLLDGMTVRHVARQYKHYIRPQLRSWRDVWRQIKRHLLPAFGDWPLAQLAPRHLQKLHDDLVAEGRKDLARKVVSAVSGLFTFAMREGWAVSNPARLVRKVRPSASRERFLDDAELARFHEALDADENQVAANLFRFLLATAWRRGEALGLTWDDVYTDRRLARLRRTKNGRSRNAPLSQDALELLDAIPKKPGNPFVFFGRRAGQPIADPMPAFRRILKRARIDDLTIHDLRRTAATRALAAGVSLVELQELLDHSSPAVTRIYARLASGALRRAADIAGRASARSAAANHEG